MATTEEKVLRALAEIRPYLKTDGGDVELVSLENNVVKLKLLGTCYSCSMSHLTMKAGIEESIKRMAPEITEVISVK